ncbi:prephenate dehydrogenase [Actinomadura macrotermitis]|uniref:Prephenate/arogenate dehydrogenase domain-containing protein n=1 Tax=Actinomadura macrotermitis TaxID=2585200 RepID=A0A7K0BQ58_9ACTN|nr:prephenate dehydrogenase [Actinomadura macrotermitis]MQY03022.1 hypothetical protein [Actinomadura macrotermitis]
MGLRSVLIVGTGLIGTSIALALRERGLEVLLADRDPAVARLAAERGAGRAVEPSGAERADLAVLAVPPGAVPAALRDVQKLGAARYCTDAASVKAAPIAEAAALGCDMTAFVGGHPLGGRERSGPLAARPGLFAGRRWVLCPTPESAPAAVEAAEALALACGAVPVVMSGHEHDRAVALTSHTPHLVASALAARFAEAPEPVMALAGQGARDVTRIAAGAPELWSSIVWSNAGPIAEALDQVAGDLRRTARALRGTGPGEPVHDLLVRGVEGYARIPGGERTGRRGSVPVLVPDRPGELALLLHAVCVTGIGVEAVAFAPGRPVGMVELTVEQGSAGHLAGELRARGWAVPVGEA